MNWIILISYLVLLGIGVQALPGSAPENGPKTPTRITDGNKKINVGTKTDEKKGVGTGYSFRKNKAGSSGTWSFSKGKALSIPQRNISPDVMRSRLATLMKSIGLLKKGSASSPASKSSGKIVTKTTKITEIRGSSKGSDKPELSLASSYDERKSSKVPGVKVISYKVTSVSSGPDEKNGAKVSRKSFSSSSKSSYSSSSGGALSKKGTAIMFSGPDEKDGKIATPKAGFISRRTRTKITTIKTMPNTYSGPDEKDGKNIVSKIVQGRSKSSMSFNTKSASSQSTSSSSSTLSSSSGRKVMKQSGSNKVGSVSSSASSAGSSSSKKAFEDLKAKLNRLRTGSKLVSVEIKNNMNNKKYEIDSNKSSLSKQKKTAHKTVSIPNGKSVGRTNSPKISNVQMKQMLQNIKGMNTAKKFSSSASSAKAVKSAKSGGKLVPIQKSNIKYKGPDINKMNSEQRQSFLKALGLIKRKSTITSSNSLSSGKKMSTQSSSSASKGKFSLTSEVTAKKSSISKKTTEKDTPETPEANSKSQSPSKKTETSIKRKSNKPHYSVQYSKLDTEGNPLENLNEMSADTMELATRSKNKGIKYTFPSSKTKDVGIGSSNSASRFDSGPGNDVGKGNSKNKYDSGPGNDVAKSKITIMRKPFEIDSVDPKNKGFKSTLVTSSNVRKYDFGSRKQVGKGNGVNKYDAGPGNDVRKGNRGPGPKNEAISKRTGFKSTSKLSIIAGLYDSGPGNDVGRRNMGRKFDSGPGNDVGRGNSGRRYDSGPGNDVGRGNSARKFDSGPGNDVGKVSSARRYDSGPGNDVGSGNSARKFDSGPGNDVGNANSGRRYDWGPGNDVGKSNVKLVGKRFEVDSVDSRTRGYKSTSKSSSSARKFDSGPGNDVGRANSARKFDSGPGNDVGRGNSRSRYDSGPGNDVGKSNVKLVGKRFEVDSVDSRTRGYKSTSKSSSSARKFDSGPGNDVGRGNSAGKFDSGPGNDIERGNSRNRYDSGPGNDVGKSNVKRFEVDSVDSRTRGYKSTSKSSSSARKFDSGPGNDVGRANSARKFDSGPGNDVGRSNNRNRYDSGPGNDVGKSNVKRFEVDSVDSRSRGYKSTSKSSSSARKFDSGPGNDVGRGNSARKFDSGPGNDVGRGNSRSRYDSGPGNDVGKSNVKLVGKRFEVDSVDSRTRGYKSTSKSSSSARKFDSGPGNDIGRGNGAGKFDSGPGNDVVRGNSRNRYDSGPGNDVGKSNVKRFEVDSVDSRSRGYKSTSKSSSSARKFDSGPGNDVGRANSARKFDSGPGNDVGRGNSRSRYDSGPGNDVGKSNVKLVSKRFEVDSVDSRTRGYKSTSKSSSSARKFDSGPGNDVGRGNGAGKFDSGPGNDVGRGNNRNRYDSGPGNDVGKSNVKRFEVDSVDSRTRGYKSTSKSSSSARKFDSGPGNDVGRANSARKFDSGPGNDVGRGNSRSRYDSGPGNDVGKSNVKLVSKRFEVDSVDSRTRGYKSTSKSSSSARKFDSGPGNDVGRGNGARKFDSGPGNDVGRGNSRSRYDSGPGNDVGKSNVKLVSKRFEVDSVDSRTRGYKSTSKSSSSARKFDSGPGNDVGRGNGAGKFDSGPGNDVGRGNSRSRYDSGPGNDVGKSNVKRFEVDSVDSRTRGYKSTSKSSSSARNFDSGPGNDVGRGNGARKFDSGPGNDVGKGTSARKFDSGPGNDVGKGNRGRRLDSGPGNDVGRRKIAKKTSSSKTNGVGANCKQGRFCGSDGVVYNNDCEITPPVYKDCDGDCPCALSVNGAAFGGSSLTPTEFPLVNAAPTTVADACPMCVLEYKPVCGSDGMTYYSDCERDCRGAFKECDGECPCQTHIPSVPGIIITPTEQYPSATEAPFCSCPNNYYSPVCGVDGQVYDNPCLLGCEGVLKACDGVCPCRQGASNDMFVPAFVLAYSQTDCGKCSYLDDEPVCGSDDTTYRNECYAKCNGSEKKCSSSCPCNS